MKKRTKKIVAVVLCLMMTLGMIIGTAPSVEAGDIDYPWLMLTPEVYQKDYYVGDMIKLEFTVFREYQNERYNVKIYNSNNTLVASADKTYQNKYQSQLTWTVSWDTTTYAPDTYTVVATSEFYSWSRWNESPNTNTYRITIKSPGSRPQYGWNSNSIGWWYVKDDGSYFVNEWAKLAGTWYYFDGNGYMLTGWANLGGRWYFFNDSGAMMTGWLRQGNIWYYLDDGGAMATGWVKLSGTWYYFDGSGAMATGWALLGGQWYFFNDSGAMMTGWIKLGSTWYYMNAGGAMATGWVQDNGSWYYLNADGSMATGWVQDNGSWYYLNADGSMATGWIFVNDCWYLLNDSGVWVG